LSKSATTRQSEEQASRSRERGTLVDQVVDAIVKEAAQGHFLPGDRVVEAEIARRLNVSRVPVREALRMLESQGIVINTPYRGMRLMDVTRDRIVKTLEVRLALEKVAARQVQRQSAGDRNVLDRFTTIIDSMREAADQDDSYGVATFDTKFHRELCRLTGNDVLLRTWESLARQLTIIFGLSTLERHIESIVDEHLKLLNGLEHGDWPSLEQQLEAHIFKYSREIDYPDYVTALRDKANGGVSAAAKREK
jgi:DNA-binding GntR family transcriptional regulator